MQDTYKDSDGEEYDVYKRLPLYTTLQGTICDYNGKEVAQVAHEYDVKHVDSMIEQLNLSRQQARILQLRMQGKSYNAIGQLLHIKEGTVQVYMKRTQERYKAIFGQPNA